jgi:hypothetical protein
VGYLANGGARAYYTITASGRRCLGAEVSSFESMVAAISAS